MAADTAHEMQSALEQFDERETTVGGGLGKDEGGTLVEAQHGVIAEFDAGTRIGTDADAIAEAVCLAQFGGLPLRVVITLDVDASLQGGQSAHPGFAVRGSCAQWQEQCHHP